LPIQKARRAAILADIQGRLGEAGLAAEKFSDPLQDFFESRSAREAINYDQPSRLGENLYSLLPPSLQTENVKRVLQQIVEAAFRRNPNTEYV
jgi:hypothetical protein